PALPAVHATPAEAAPPGKAAAVPAGTMPAVEIEAIAAAFDNVDGGLLDEVRRIERRLQSAGTHRHSRGAGRGQTECRRCGKKVNVFSHCSLQGTPLCEGSTFLRRIAFRCEASGRSRA